MRRTTQLLSILLCFVLLFEQSGFAQVETQNFASLHLSAHLASFRNTLSTDKYRPLHLRYLGYDAKSNDFKLLLDKGDFVGAGLASAHNLQKEKNINQETNKLMEYFFIGLSLPNESFWVNLRPNSPDNTIDSALAQTDIGKILLEADVQLKKDTALYTSPQTKEGKAYWDKLYKKAEELYGYDNITIPTLTRPWIVPGEIIIRETPDNAYIYKATLKVMLEEDYLKVNSRQQTVVSGKEYEFKDPRAKELNTYSTQLIKELIIPNLTKEINTSRRYAALRQVYYSLILAQWFKQRFRAESIVDSPLSIEKTKDIAGTGLAPVRLDYKNIINSGNLTGLTSKTPWSKDTYYQQYQKSFKDGEYNLKEPARTPFGQTIRSYFSGGISFASEAVSSAVKLRISPVNSNRDISTVLVSSTVNRNIFSAVLKGDNLEISLPKEMNISSAVSEDLKLSVSSAVQSKEKDNELIEASKKLIDESMNKLAQTDKLLEDIERINKQVEEKIAQMKNEAELSRILNDVMTIIPFIKEITSKCEIRKAGFGMDHLLGNMLVGMEGQLISSYRALEQEIIQIEKNKPKWMPVWLYKASTEEKRIIFTGQVNKLKKLFEEAIRQRDKLQRIYNISPQHLASLLFNDVKDKFDVHFRELWRLLLDKNPMTSDIVSRFIKLEQLFLQYKELIDDLKTEDTLLKYAISTKGVLEWIDRIRNSDRNILLFIIAEQSDLLIDMSFDKEELQFLGKLALAKFFDLFNSQSKSGVDTGVDIGETVLLGNLLLNIAGKDSELKVGLAPVIIMNAFRERGFSDECPFISIHKPSNETKLYRFIASFTTEEIEQLRQRNIPGLMRVIDNIRNNPMTFRDKTITPVGSSHKIINPVCQQMQEGLVDMGLFMPQENDKRIWAVELFTRIDWEYPMPEQFYTAMKSLLTETKYGLFQDKILEMLRGRIEHGDKSAFLMLSQNLPKFNESVRNLLSGKAGTVNAHYYIPFFRGSLLFDVDETGIQLLAQMLHKAPEEIRVIREKLKRAKNLLSDFYYVSDDYAGDLIDPLIKYLYPPVSHIFKEKELKTVIEIFNSNLIAYFERIKNLLKSLSDNQECYRLFLSQVLKDNSLNEVIKNMPGNSIVNFTGALFKSDTVREDLKKEYLEKVSPEIMAKALGINIKLARFLKDRKDNIVIFLNRLSEPAFKESINEIAYNLNRELTLHPVERRLGEDEKNSLFDLLFSPSIDIQQAKQVFDAYFKNEPTQYRIDIPRLNELLEYTNIDELKRIIKSIVDNPKQSLEEITANIKQQLQNHPNAEFISRRIIWILSNLFVLQDKIEQLEPFLEVLQKKGESTADLRIILGQIDKSQRFSELYQIAEVNGLNFIDVLIFKLESNEQTVKEDIIYDGFSTIDGVSIEQRNNIFEELVRQFSYQPIQSRTRIYLKVLFNQNTDNSIIMKAIDELASAGELSGFKKTPLIKQFLGQHRNLIRKNAFLREYLSEAENIEDRLQQKEALKQIRSLYQDRQYAVTKVPDAMRERISELEQQILYKQPVTQIPHIFYEPLLRMKPDSFAFDALRLLIAAMNGNQNMRDQLAALKNRLNDKVILFAGSTFELKSNVFAGILKATTDIYGSPTVENIDKFYTDLMFYLEQYSNAIDIYDKAKGGSNDIGEGLVTLCRVIIGDLLIDGKIDKDKINQLVERLGTAKIELLLARVKQKITLDNEEKLVEKIRNYAVNNPKSKWTDDQGRDIYCLMDIYLRTIGDDEIYKNIIGALEAEVNGRFKEYRYKSIDYLKTIDEIILIMVSKLREKEQAVFQDAIKQAQGETVYEKLQNIEGFNDIKDKVEKIKDAWEGNLVIQLDNGWTAEFSDDFYVLFNVGNSKYFEACQNCAYGSDLNRGLGGYMVNGTNKALVLLDENRRVVTRRIVRLKILQKEKTRLPGIFVEESTQFGSTEIDKLYDLLESAANKAKLPVMASQHRPAQTEKVLSGEKGSYAFELYRGRSTFDYSDLFGNTLTCKLNAGLYRQTEPVIITGYFELVEKRFKAVDVEIPAVSSGVLQDFNHPHEIVLKLLSKESELLNIENKQTVSEERIYARRPSVQASSGIGNKQNVPSPGGIDFTVMPAVVHPVMSPQDNFKINPGKIVSSSLNNIKLGDGDEPEWFEIQKMVHAGIVPSSQRIREYLVSSCVRGEFNQEMDKVICCISDVFRLEEERLNSADSDMCEILGLVESCKTSSELLLALSRQ